VLGPVLDSSQSTNAKGPVIFIGTPAYDGWKGRYVPSLIEATRHLNGKGFRVQHSFALGCSLVTNARAELLGAFLSSQAEWFVGIDNDIGWPEDLISRMIGFGEPMMCAAVPYRKIDVDALSERGNYSDGITFNVEPTSMPDLRAMPARDGFRLVNDVGTAFYVARRETFLAMARRYYDLEIEVTGMKSFALYHQMLHDRKALGEDRSFFRRWHQMGGKTWCVEDAEIIHSGPIDVAGNLYHKLEGTLDPARRWLKGAVHTLPK
jgi:hypothetical protein